ncbi:MAG: sigma-70 family RNA polymerase sigma factor [Clostridiales bacterium]|nr:sigma-70 family RNA polymerase sigma factor [Clostridiales bacterium]
MYISKEEREDYERRFNGYIMRIIKNEYIRFSKKRCRKSVEISLNDYTESGIERIECIVGENDIEIREFFTPDELELICEDEVFYRAIKPLTRREKLTVFLCVILEQSATDAAKIMNYSSVSSVTRLLEKAISKIQNNLKNNGGNKND